MFLKKEKPKFEICSLYSVREKRKCYSDDEILATEKRFHGKLPLPIRDIYRHMADLLVTSGYLRPLKLLHWEGNYLGFFLAPGEGDIIGIKKGASSGDLYAWEENDPKDSWPDRKMI